MLTFSCFTVQETESVGDVVFVHDLSFNGTFLNGTKIGMTMLFCYLMIQSCALIWNALPRSYTEKIDKSERCHFCQLHRQHEHSENEN